MSSFWHFICHFLTKTSQNLVKFCKNQPKNRDFFFKNALVQVHFSSLSAHLCKFPPFPLFLRFGGTLNFGPTFQNLAPPPPVKALRTGLRSYYTQILGHTNEADPLPIRFFPTTTGVGVKSGY